MDKQQAQSLIEATFEKPFKKERFSTFIKNLLNFIDESKAFHAHGEVKEMFKHIIKTYERLGTYNDPDGKKTDIIVVYLQKGYSLNYARVTQRNFAGRYLADRGEKDAGLFAFVSPDQDDWRFSLVTMDYEIVKTKSDKWKAHEKFSQAKRWSFLVGKNEASHTAKSQLAPILADDQHNPTLSQLKETFNIETVTKEFFEKYRELFSRTKEKMDEIVKQDAKIKANFEDKHVDTVNFAKKLLGQIVFLYFLQKKGWFGVERDAKWGTGSKQFLRELFNGKHGKYRNFFNNILEPLFYEALRCSRDYDYYSRFNCKIPFLNGGLFDPINNYDWEHTDILLPNELFSNKNKTKQGDIGNGILDIFDRYNFTVKEDEPLEKEVAIDPEMLGKVFENLLQVKDRKSKGTYYTPREIVHYMCQQSLINYLYTELNKGITSYQKIGVNQINAFGNKVKDGQLDLTAEHQSSPQIAKQDIETLIKYGEQVGENEIAVETKGKETKTYSYKLPESIRKNARQIDDKLANIKVCDPAIGSGAFPVGMMHEIVKTRNVLSAFIKDSDKTIYHFKRECIESSLYGVDIDPGAVEIAKLRLWLSLIVDEQDFKQIRPLPNLDYKIVQGNSLLGLPDITMKDTHLESEIEKLKIKYFNETNPENKKQLKNQINQKFKDLVQSAKEFSSNISDIDFEFKIHFSEIFHENSGFDVVIANPPYVRQEKIRDQKPLLEKQGYDVYNSISDLYTYFYEKSYHILKPNGFSCFISSNKWIRAKYGEKLRRFFKEKTTLKQIIDFNGYQVFDATVDTDILVFQKTKPSENIVRILNIQLDFTPSTDITDYFNSHKLEMKQSDFDSNCFTFADETIMNLKKKIEQKGIPLKNWDVKIYRGITTGLNEVFIVDKKIKNELVKRDKKSLEILKPILRGKDVNKWFYELKGFYLIYTYTGIDIRKYQAIYEYLKQYKSKLEQVWEAKHGKKKWYELRGCDYYEEFKKEKIVWQLIVQESSFSYDTNKLYCLDTGFIMVGKNLKYLIALLNSKPIDTFFRKYYVGNTLGRNGYKYSKVYIEQLPIPKISESEQKPFIDIVDKILAITKDDDYLENPAKQAKVKEYEKQIDWMVYKLYGLNEEEIKIVECKYKMEGYYG